MVFCTALLFSLLHALVMLVLKPKPQIVIYIYNTYCHVNLTSKAFTTILSCNSQIMMEVGLVGRRHGLQVMTYGRSKHITKTRYLTFIFFLFSLFFIDFVLKHFKLKITKCSDHIFKTTCLVCCHQFTLD